MIMKKGINDRKPITGAEVNDLNVFNQKMPHEEIVEDHGRQRRRAVFDVPDDELKMDEMSESEEDFIKRLQIGRAHV